MLRRQSPGFDWALFFYWLVATAAGMLAGWLFVPAIALPAGGVAVALLQGAVLYRTVPKVWQWILASAAGWMAGVVASLVLVPPGFGLLTGTIIGALTGAAQWLVLRRYVHWAGWWIVVSCLAWAIGLGSGLDSMPRALLSGVMAGTLSGLVLDLLLRQPKALEEEEEENDDDPGWPSEANQ
jgi:hypothetical protein